MNKKIIFKQILSGAIVTSLLLPMVILAQQSTGDPNTTGETGDPITFNIKIKPPFKGGNSLPAFIETVIKEILMPIGAVVAVLMVMYAGFLFVTAGGDTAKIAKAKAALLYAVIGAAILLGAWVISKAIQGTIKQLE